MKSRPIDIDILPVSVAPDYEIEAPSLDCPLAALVRALALSMVFHPDFRAPQFEPADERFTELEPTERPRVIEVVLCKNVDDLPILLDNDNLKGAVGAFAISSGLFDTDCWMADAFRVVVPCDLSYLRTFAAEERDKETDPQDDRYDLEYLKAYLVTLTHELAHAREFILHGEGHTPAEIDDAFDCGLIDVDCKDVASGRLIRADMLELDPEESVEVMEDRVEAQGRAWLDWAFARVPRELSDEVLREIRPKAAARKRV